MSTYERQVAAKQIIPERVLTKITRMTKESKANVDSLLASSRSSDGPQSQRSEFRETDNVKDQKIFSKILRKEGADFLKLDLSTSSNADVNSGSTAMKLLRTFIKWNNNNPENCIHFYIGDLLERQLAVSRIQKWFR